MPVTARLACIRSDGDELRISLHTCDGPVTVPVRLSPKQAHALRHLNACITTAGVSPDVAAPTDLLVTLLVRHGLAPEAIELTLDRGMRLHYGPSSRHSIDLHPVDGVALLLRGELPVVLDLPSADADWDEALAGLDA